jgi:hypothetical protein
MFFAGLVFVSAVSISLTAAYFSVIGLATMFPGSREAIIIMGGVLEIGKLIASVWLHHNWNNAFKFLKRYLLFSVVVLSLITSMGIFGFLSRSHVEHHASIEKEQAIIQQIDDKINRELKFIERKELEFKSLNESMQSAQENSSDTVAVLESRVKLLKEEKSSSISVQEKIITNISGRLLELDLELKNAKPSGLFGSQKKYDQLVDAQKKEKESLASQRLSIEEEIQSISSSFDDKIKDSRDKIDNILIGTSIAPKETSVPRTVIEEAYDRIDVMESEKFEYGSKLRALEVEIGPILYIANMLNEWAGMSIDTNQAIRVVIITLIFVFDPLAILLLIAATMTFAAHKKEELPPDVKAIRNKLLEELQEYIDEGGLADHFIERAKK